MEDNFVWTEEMICEFADKLKNSGGYIWGMEVRQYTAKEFIEFYKQSNPQPSTKATDDVRERITAFRIKENNTIWNKTLDGGFIAQNLPSVLTADNILSRGGGEIYSALSKDKVEWKIGDVSKQGKIISFYIEDNKLAVRTSEFRDGDCNIDSLTKAEEKKVLFTTEDGVDIFADTPFVNFVHVINSDGLSVATVAISKSIAEVLRGKKIFSTEQKAKEYIAYNQKSISFKELEDYVLRAAFIISTDEKVVNVTELMERFRP